MAIDQPKVWRRSQFAAAIETTTGAAATLNAAAAAYNAFNAVCDEESDSEERPGQSSFSGLPPIPGAQGGSCELTTELYGSGTAGTAPGWANTLLTSCGFSVASGVATPLTAQPQTLTMGVIRDGRLLQIAGAQGDLTITYSMGKSVKLAWKYKGKWIAPTDVSLLTPTYPTIIPPKFAGGTITIGGTAVRISEMVISMGCQIVLRPDPNDPTGYHAAFIVGRKPTLKLDPEAQALSVANYYNMREASVSAALNCVVGSVSGNTITTAAPNMYLSPPPKGKNRGDVYADDLSWLPARVSAAGDDELSINFG